MAEHAGPPRRRLTLIGASKLWADPFAVPATLVEVHQPDLDRLTNSLTRCELSDLFQAATP